MAINLILAFVGAAGVFAAVLSLGMRPRVRLQGFAEQRPGPIERLRQYLTEADLGVKPNEFLRISVLLGIGMGIAAYLLTSAPTAAILGCAVGGLAYYTYLVDRRDRRRQEYQDALVDVIGLLVEGFKAGNTLPAAFDTVAQYGPEIVREDWARVCSRLQTGGSLEEVLDELCRRRRDPILATIAQTIVVVSRKGGQVSTALGGLQDSVRERVRIRRRVRAEQNQPMWELRLVAAMPFLVVPVLRGMSAEYLAFWQTPLGQVFLTASWGLTIAGYLIAQRYITVSTKVEESFGVVEMPGAGEQPAGLPQKEES
jgi:tight adherence protein B